MCSFRSDSDVFHSCCFPLKSVISKIQLRCMSRFHSFPISVSMQMLRMPIARMQGVSMRRLDTPTALIWGLISLLVAGCSGDERSASNSPREVLRLAVTTSFRDSGLIDELAPMFEAKHDVRIDVIAVGTGAALKLGMEGEVDAVLVHAREAEDEFMAAGHGVRRESVMHNMFFVLGPKSDPAKIRGMAPAAALKKIAVEQWRFVSRGDDSGTHKRESRLWQATGGRTPWDEYLETGQGMGATLTMADQMNAYVLCDSGTYFKFKKKIQLESLIDSAAGLRNLYGVVVVNPKKHEKINTKAANHFADFLISHEAADRIRNYKIDGQQLFFPDSTSVQN